MMEEKSHEHDSHEKRDGKYKFEISKVRIWQGISLILAIAVVFLWFNQGSESTGTALVQVPSEQPGPSAAQQQPTKQDIDVDDDPFLGPKDAKVVVVEFSDFECPYCGAAMGTHEALVQRFKSQDPNWEAAVPKLKELAKQGKIRFVFRDFPLGFHSQAQPAAEASECADEQGKFWDYHDALFENQDSLGNSLYVNLAEQLGLDVDKFKTCIETNKYEDEVKADLNYGQSIGVSGTPAFFINGMKISGAQPYSVFKQIIDAELAD